jgi:TolA-binding protein
MRKGSDVCVKYDVSRAPTILVLDASLPAPESKPLARITGSRNPRELRRDLDEALAAAGAATGTAAAPPLPPSPPRKEELSDDALDRKFIQARIDVAKGLIQQNKPKDAIGVLEDVIKSYPKHTATADAVKLLEKLKP